MKEEEGGEPAGQDGDDEERGPACALMTAVSIFQRKFEAELRETSRNLLVRDLMVCFDPASIFGRRQGFVKALMVTVARQACLSNTHPPAFLREAAV